MFSWFSFALAISANIEIYYFAFLFCTAKTLIGSMYHQSGLVIENWLDQQRHPPGQSANSSSTSSTPLRWQYVIATVRGRTSTCVPLKLCPLSRGQTTSHSCISALDSMCAYCECRLLICDHNHFISQFWIPRDFLNTRVNRCEYASVFLLSAFDHSNFY